ncbi:MAG: hypothetical protein LBE31_06105 [Deltaproteobacteria bacterium]|jgi:hypothetical protein|nr:hypothetical protein [Deltaproteobacteria bacterium]
MTFAPFTVTRVESHPATELLERLRNVVMLKDREAKPYAKATLTLGQSDFSRFRPAQRYVLTDNLLKIQCLNWELARLGYDALALEGYLTIWTDASSEPIDLLPPIIESIPEATGEMVNVINDGMHRLFVGRLEWKKPVVVLAEDLPEQYPYYAYPIPGHNPWDHVVILEGGSVPANVIKKWHRTSDNKRLYRDFNSAFTNVGGPRGQG